MIKNLSVTVAAYFSCAIVTAQDYPAKNIYRTYIEVSGHYADQRAFEDVSGLYRTAGGSLLVSVPVISKVIEGKDMTKKLFGVVVKGKGELNIPEIVWAPTLHNKRNGRPAMVHSFLQWCLQVFLLHSLLDHCLCFHLCSCHYKCRPAQ